MPLFLSAKDASGPVRFAHWTFLIAGIYGLLAVLPNYFLEQRMGEDYPPPITHPEYFYGFVGVAVAFQVAFLIIARDPVRYRPMMIPSVIEKFSFAIAVYVLAAQHRVPGVIIGFGTIDLVLGIMFLMAFVRTKR